MSTNLFHTSNNHKAEVTTPFNDKFVGTYSEKNMRRNREMDKRDDWYQDADVRACNVEYKKRELSINSPPWNAYWVNIPTTN